MDTTKNKCYALPIEAAYQMTQSINGFQAKFGISADLNTKNMTYYDQKRLQVGTFGTGKAQRKLASVMANQVDEDADLEAALKSKRAKGTHDGRLDQAADHVAGALQEVKKAASQSVSKRIKNYAREKLLPVDTIKQLPYKQTRKALKDEDRDALKEVLCSFVATIAEKTKQYSWPQQAEEQKKICQELVYLDALIRLYRMPPQFTYSSSDLSERFKNIPEDILITILQKFCRVSLSDQMGNQFVRGSAMKDADPNAQFKFIKSKENTQQLTLAVIGAVVHLSTQGKSKGYFLERILKKTIGDLRNYFKELGLVEEATKRRDRDSGNEVDDVFVYFGYMRQTKKQDPEVAATEG